MLFSVIWTYVSEMKIIIIQHTYTHIPKHFLASPIQKWIDHPWTELFIFLMFRALHDFYARFKERRRRHCHSDMTLVQISKRAAWVRRHTCVCGAHIVVYLIFIDQNLCPLHMDVAVLVACQQSARSLFHPASLGQELGFFTVGWVLFCTLQQYKEMEITLRTHNQKRAEKGNYLTINYTCKIQFKICTF